MQGRDGLRRQKLLLVLTPELAVEVSVLGKPRAAQLHVRFRIATVEHIERQEAREALLDAESNADYTTLLAQMKRGRHRGVEAALIARAASSLKLLTPTDVPQLDELRSKLYSAALTVPPPGRDETRCGACSIPGCSVPELLPGEELEVDPSGAEAAFDLLRGRLGDKPGGGRPAGEWLFNVFAAAAVRAAEDGGVWKGYGKFNLSAPSRNQAPDELRRYLRRIGQVACCAALDALVLYVERRYGKRVAAVQINVHMDLS